MRSVTRTASNAGRAYRPCAVQRLPRRACSPRGMRRAWPPVTGLRTMVLEVAQIEVKAGLETEFETGVANSAPLFQRAKGCKSMRLERSIENPSLYFLVV